MATLIRVNSNIFKYVNGATKYIVISQICDFASSGTTDVTLNMTCGTIITLSFANESDRNDIIDYILDTFS